MDRDLIEKYKKEMLDMHRLSKIDRAVNFKETATPVAEEEETGRIVATVTTLRNLYPVANAEVIIFTGPYENMEIKDRDITNSSGITKVFQLYAPNKDLSQTPNGATPPFAKYNMLVRADGYVDNIHLNIPVFSGVTSVQNSDMVLLSAAGQNTGPIIFDESDGYNL